MNPRLDPTKKMYSSSAKYSKRNKDNISHSAYYEKDLAPWITPEADFS